MLYDDYFQSELVHSKVQRYKAAWIPYLLLTGALCCTSQNIGRKTANKGRGLSQRKLYGDMFMRKVTVTFTMATTVNRKGE